MFPESGYVVMSGKKLAVIKIRSQGAASIAVILGIDKQELIKVTCVNKKNEDVDISKGKCFDEIKKSFKLA
jgi:UDP-N-acetyl-D-mannosaminuronic acid transferase (WecB/TagA/CpsF family)